MKPSTTSLSVLALVGTTSSVALANYHYGPGSQPFPSDISGNPEFDCAYRSLAWEFAKKVQPSHDATLTFDALMLGSYCNQTRPIAGSTGSTTANDSGGDGNRDSRSDSDWTGADDCSIYVSVTGDDSHSGASPADAKRTVQAGVDAARQHQNASKSVCIGPGTYRLTSAITLSAQDSGLTIRGKAGQTWLSGALRVNATTWTAFKQSPASAGSLAVTNDEDNQSGCHPDTPTSIQPGQCGCLANLTSADACAAECRARGPEGCPSFAWSGEGQGAWTNQCCIRMDGHWSPSPNCKAGGGCPNHTVGDWRGAHGPVNVWKTTLQLPTDTAASGGVSLPAGPHLRVQGVRSSRARSPNADPERDFWPTGWVPDALEWLPAKPPPSGPTFVQVCRYSLW